MPKSTEDPYRPPASNDAQDIQGRTPTWAETGIVALAALIASAVVFYGICSGAILLAGTLAVAFPIPFDGLQGMVVLVVAACGLGAAGVMSRWVNRFVARLGCRLLGIRSPEK